MMALRVRVAVLFSGLALVCAASAAMAQTPVAQDEWRRIAGRDRRARPLGAPWSAWSTTTCDNVSWSACVDLCRDGAINACSDLVRVFAGELPLSDESVARERLALVADALDTSELLFGAACRQTPSIALACETVRRVTFARYRLACRYAAGDVRDTDGSVLRDGACRGVDRLLEDSAVSSDGLLLDSGLATLRAHCSTDATMPTATCALAVSLHAREGLLNERMFDASGQSTQRVLDAVRVTCANGTVDSAREWTQVCSALIERRAWSDAELQQLCATREGGAVYEACGGVARGFRLDFRSRAQLPVLSGSAEPERDTRWFDGPIGVVPEVRFGGVVAFAPRASRSVVRAAAVSVSVAARVRWHWLEVVAGLGVHGQGWFDAFRAQIALDFVLQPGVVIVTTAMRPTAANTVFTASAGVVLRGGPAEGAREKPPWMGAVGGYARFQWHRSSRESLGAGVQLELTAPTWAAGDPALGLYGIVSW